MATAKRDKQFPGVAYSHSKHSAEEFTTVSSDIYALNTNVMNSEAETSADSVYEKYSKALRDIVSPNEPDLLIFEAFSKLDMSSSLGSKLLVAGRILTNEERTRGIRILSSSFSKDQRYGSKVGYKRIPPEAFVLKDEEVTRVFTTLSTQIGLSTSFYENSKVLVMQSTGRRHDDACRTCQTVVEYCISKTENPVFRRSLPRTNDPVPKVRPATERRRSA